MQLQKAHVSIVRSIRQVSLVRDWHRSRAGRELPSIDDFVPDERAGDSADILITEVRQTDGTVSFMCCSAGERVEQLYDARMSARPLDECLDWAMASAARPIWDACVRHQLPIYSIIPLTDSNGCPVTVEQIFLPYTRGGNGVDIMLGALHAWSTDGRFASQGVFRNVAKVPLHWAIIVDPAIERVAQPALDTEHDDIVIDDGCATPSVQ